MSTPAAVARREPVEGDPDARTLLDAFAGVLARQPDEVAVRAFDGSLELTWAEYAERADGLSRALAAAGVRAGDTVALHLTNRPEFHVADLGAMRLGAIPFSVYATAAPEQVAHLFANAANRVVVTEAQFVPTVLAARGDGAEPSTIVCVDGEPEGTVSLETFVTSGDPAFDVDAAAAEVTGEHVLTLIYTSGTTGPPKGVELTHANLLAQCRGVGARVPFRPAARFVSYLPSAHIADRWGLHYTSLVWGTQITCVSDARQIGAALAAVRPDAFGAVPRVLEKLKAALEAGIAADPDAARRAVVEGALAAAREQVRAGEQPDEHPALAALRAKIGLDEAEWLMVGASPLAPAVEEFLRALGLRLTQVYGMSELSCCLTCSTLERARAGTVGELLDGCEHRFADDGELLIRSPMVMRGYRGEPAKTAETIDADGWLATGDIVEEDPDGHLRIVDRKKELIINAAGKNMSPANIEGLLKAAHPLMGQVVVIGDNRPFNVALVVLDPDAAASRGGTEALAADPALREELDAAIAVANGRMARVEQIKRYALLADEWLPGGDELTPTMKLKRKPIAAKYAEEIEALYAR